MSKNLINPALLAGGLLLALPAVANDWNCYSKHDTEFAPCFYGGAGLGISRFEPDENSSGWDVGDNRDNGFLVYGGYQFAPEWFAEFAYADMGEAEVDARNPLLPSGTISYEVPNIMAGYYIDPYRLSEGEIPEIPVDIFIKAGLSAIQNSVSSGAIPYDQKSNVQFALAAGLEWRFAKSWKFRTAVESYDVDALFFTASVAYIFGEGAPAEPVRKPVIMQKVEPAPAPAPEPVVREPEPLPSPIIEISEPVSCSTFDGSIEGVVFKVNSDELTEPSKVILLKTASVLKKFPDAHIEIQAHTDSDGSAEYNHKLSARRAESVKAFFIKDGIDAARLTAVGYGEDQPVANNATVEGKAKNRRVELRTDKLEACD